MSARPGHRGPNLFLVGAPKCGTTSLAAYLGAHRNIFVSDPKEPNYFARHLSVTGSYLSRMPWHTTMEGYLALFQQASADQSVVAEASTRYLRSARALIDLREFQPRARIIVSVRNPVDLARSWHAQKLLEGQEPEPRFERAWRLEASREAGRLPRGADAVDALCYRRVASLGTQLRQLLEIFSRDQVFVVLFDELKRDPRVLYERMLAFLDVKPDGRQEFPVINARSHWRWSWIPRVLARAPRGLRGLLMRPVLQQCGPAGGEKGPLRENFQKELDMAFEPEIDLLERILDVDLARWRMPQ